MNSHPPHFADSVNGHTKIIKITHTPTPNHIKSYGKVKYYQHLPKAEP